MKNLRGTYVRRGDVERRRRRVRAGFMLAGLLAAAALGARNWEPGEANAASVQRSVGARLGLAHEPREVVRDVGFAAAQLERWHQIFNYSRRYRITSDLAEAIFDAATAEQIDPALAFPLVRLESEFKQRATSPVGAIGLTQLMLGTARGYLPDVTREQLYERDLNLRIGFRYLRDLIREYRGNVALALLVYNRGPYAVAVDRELGLDPSNGYDRIVLRGYRGKGVIKSDQTGHD
jgi:soluble lytic murein transglycosylase-like protein